MPQIYTKSLSQRIIQSFLQIQFLTRLTSSVTPTINRLQESYVRKKKEKTPLKTVIDRQLKEIAPSNETALDGDHAVEGDGFLLRNLIISGFLAWICNWTIPSTQSDGDGCSKYKIPRGIFGVSGVI